MKKNILMVGAFLVVTALALALIAEKKFTVLPSPTPSSLNFLSLPPGFHMEVFADGLSGKPISTPGPNQGPRMMEFKEDTVFVSVPSEGRVYVFKDKNKDGRLDENGKKNLLTDSIVPTASPSVATSPTSPKKIG